MGNKYVTPYEDKNHFDKQLFDSIEPPRKPPSAKKAFIISSIPVVLFMFIVGPAALVFEAVALVIYFLFKSYEKDWQHKMDNLEQYKISRYNSLKSQKDKQELIETKRANCFDADTWYICAPHTFGKVVAHYSVHTDEPCRVEIIQNEEHYMEIPFHEIIGAEILMNEARQDAVGRAIVGGAIAGDVGAIIGATTASKTVKSLVVRIFSNNVSHPAYDIRLIDSTVEVGSKEYNTAITFANDVLASIKSIISNQQSSKARKQNAPQNSINPTEEILKYKQLLDCSAITSEEYEQKKKQLLGL